MRKLVELAVVFLLGWALAGYFFSNDKDNDISHTVPGPETNRNGLPGVTAELPDSPPAAVVSGVPQATELDKVKRQLQQGDITAVIAALQQYRADLLNIAAHHR